MSYSLERRPRAKSAHSRAKSPFVHLGRFIIAKRVFQMLHYETIHPDTLELLRKIQSLEMFKDARLVGGVVFHRVCPSVYAISDTRASG